jgi:ABC-type multidrug transport system permease subunit
MTRVERTIAETAKGIFIGLFLGLIVLLLGFFFPQVVNPISFIEFGLFTLIGAVTGLLIGFFNVRKKK